MTALKIVKRKFKGFTLIELLIVITIIGILATFVVASFTSAQSKARDGRRKSDVDAIKKALELAKGDSSAGAFYPGCATAAPCYTTTSMVPDIIAAGYIKATPNDPNQSGASNYQYAPNPTAVLANTATGFTLSACLENNNDVGGNTTASAGFSRACPANARIYFVTQP